MGNKYNGSQWISLSDMMTGLMLVFLLLSILVISEVKKLEEELKKNEENKNRVLIEYNNVKEDIYKDLKKAFQEKEKEWEMTIDDDLTIKFNNPEVLFKPNSEVIRKSFKNILNEFTPKYLSIINDNKYNEKIREIRIEGHAGICTEREYIPCLTLSQKRSNEVLKYIFNTQAFTELSDNEESKMKFLITSNGMSNGKNLDHSGSYIYYSKEDVDGKLSRRVEFRIVTNSEKLVEDLLKRIKGQ